MGNRKQAVDFYNQALVALQDQSNPQRLNHAYQLFSSACLTDPTWAEGWYQAGNNNNDLKLYPAAIACWREALKCESDVSLRGKIMNNIAWRLHGLGEVREARECAQQAIALDDQLDAAWINLSVIYGTLDDSKRSVECAERGVALSPGNAMNEFALGMALLFDGQWKRGFHHLESRFAYRLKNFLTYPYPKWDGSDGKTIYLVSDQGLGDTLSFARFVPELCRRSTYVHATVHKELLLLFQRAFAGIPNLHLFPQGNFFPPADAWTTFVSLPAALNLSDDEIVAWPHISVDRYDIPVPWRISDRRLHIGVQWSGSAANDINHLRSIPVTQFLELYRVPGIQLYGLQMDQANQEHLAQGAMSLIFDLSTHIATVVDTVAFLRKLDLVICCESALAHICALAGTECWVPYSYLGRDYRLGHKGENQLWSKHRVFRQDPDLRWEPVFRRMCEALEERLARRRAA